MFITDNDEKSIKIYNIKGNHLEYQVYRDLTESDCESVNWKYLAQATVQWWGLENQRMHYNVGSFLANCETIGFSRTFLRYSTYLSNV
jgi:hypothetical protein